MDEFQTHEEQKAASYILKGPAFARPSVPLPPKLKPLIIHNHRPYYLCQNKKQSNNQNHNNKYVPNKCLFINFFMIYQKYNQPQKQCNYNSLSTSFSSSILSLYSSAYFAIPKYSSSSLNDAFG